MLKDLLLLDELDIRRWSETGAGAAGGGGGAGAAGGPEGRGGGGGGAGTEELAGRGGGGGGTGRSSVVPVPFSGAGVVSAGSSTRAEPSSLGAMALPGRCSVLSLAKLL